MNRKLPVRASGHAYAVVAALATTLLGTPAPAADVAHGQEVYRACAACHTEKPDALGPSLKGVIGRKSAALDDFRYSNPMRRANLVWDEANLRQFLADPQAKVAGTRMPFGGLGDPKDIDDVVGYLATLK
ncbi:MAG TPA: c-type cytochrome [Xanthobacteraceae bacterium]|nr:c-type cytochrome [Xanthobacteraceae bacterium]